MELHAKALSKIHPVPVTSNHPELHPGAKGESIAKPDVKIESRLLDQTKVGPVKPQAHAFAHEVLLTKTGNRQVSKIFGQQKHTSTAVGVEAAKTAVGTSLKILVNGPNKWPLLVFPAAHPVRVCWDIIIVFALVHIFVFLPLEFVYAAPVGGVWTAISITVDLVFWIDIIVCFRTSYYTADGDEVRDPKKIATNYIKDFFFLDVLCCLPGYPVSVFIVDIANGFDASGTAALKTAKAPRIMRVVRGIKFVKVLRVLKVLQFLEDLRDAFPQSMIIYKMLKLFVFTSFYLHINACSFSFVAQLQPHGESWTDSFDFRDHWFEEYVNAVYWSTSTCTTVGYGDISPVSAAEKGYCIISMAVGVGVYGYIIGSMTEVITSMSFVEHQLQQRMDQVYEFLRRYDFPLSTRQRLLRFYRNYFKKKKYIDENEVMQLLPPNLLGLVRDAILSDGLNTIPFVRWVDPKFFPRVIGLLQPRLCRSTEAIIVANEAPLHAEFYIVSEGTVTIFEPYHESPFASGKLTKKERTEMCSSAIRKLYDEFDENGDGVIDQREMRLLLKAVVGDAINDKMVEVSMQSLTNGSDSDITVEEFTRWFLSTHLEKIDTLVYGLPLAVIQPWHTFGIWNGFNLGKGEATTYQYLAGENTELLVLNVKELLMEFKDEGDILQLIEDTLTGPARHFGNSVDLEPPSSINAVVQSNLERTLCEYGYDASMYDAFPARGSLVCDSTMTQRTKKSLFESVFEAPRKPIMNEEFSGLNDDVGETKGEVTPALTPNHLARRKADAIAKQEKDAHCSRNSLAGSKFDEPQMTESSLGFMSEEPRWQHRMWRAIERQQRTMEQMVATNNSRHQQIFELLKTVCERSQR